VNGTTARSAPLVDGMGHDRLFRMPTVGTTSMITSIAEADVEGSSKRFLNLPTLPKITEDHS